ncbi:MAG: ABC transporter [Betaproteobacteria bacterium SG8_41]|nr:MAG: ABC transporter [Betaproteobacteria bacterium SG8_41]
MREASVSAGAFVWSLQALCDLHRIPFSPALALQEFAPPYSLFALRHATEAAGLKSGLRSVPLKELQRLPVPFVVTISSLVQSARLEDPPPERSGATCGLAIVLNCDAQRISFIEEGAREPISSSLEEFGTRYRGEVLLLARPASSLRDPDAASDSEARFGFRWFLAELLRHRSVWRDVLLASLAIQLMALATPVFTQIVIDKVIVHQTLSTLAVIGIALCVFILFTAGMSWVRQYLMLHTGNRIDAVLGLHVFEHLFRLPPRYFERRPTGVLVARLQGVENIREFLSGAAVVLILDVPFLLIFVAIMFYYSVTLTMITLAILLLVVGLSAVITPVLRRRLNQQFLLGARNQAFLTEYVAGMETVKSLQMEPQLNKRFGDYLASYLQAGFKTRQLASTYNVAANLLEQLLMLAILCTGAWLVMTSQSFTVGMLVAFQMFANRLSQPMLHMVGLWQQFQQADIAVRRLGDVMNAPAEPYGLMPARETRRDGQIHIRDLSFRYDSNRTFLFRGLNLAIEPGKCVALMGPSGCGKSTLAKLLQGFYQPEEGSIILDDRDIRYLSANELRQYFGVVPQETVLFSGTIYENLVLANPHASFEEVVQSCRLAEIHDTIEQLPDGYQTQIGEHGAGLSGGQKQRISIARALLKRPRILIFDEATSSLDPVTSEQFARTVNRFRSRVTIIFISHRLPKGLQVDSVVTLGASKERGQVLNHEFT